MVSTDPSPQGLPNWKVTLSYDGTDFRGWQVQPGQTTVQGELQAALRRVTGETPLPQGSGRTDAGVHALAQVASFGLRASIPAENLVRALNRTLPPAIRVHHAQRVPEGFHARHSALAKTYEYRVLVEQGGRGDSCSPFAARYVYGYPWRLDMEVLQAAADHFVGKHDFLSFAATDPDVARRTAMAEASAGGIESASAVRTIFSSGWTKRPTESGELLIYRVRGNGFLHHMVRNIVGTMIEAGRGALQAEEIPRILAARSRAMAGPTAPARGLFLHSVEYPAEFAGQ